MTNMPTFTTRFRQQGLSLVELMIALALSTTLILGIFTVYFDSNKTARLGTALARIQESARVGMEMISRDMRMVGFQGCADPNNVTMSVIAQNPPTADFAATALRGWEIAANNWADGTEFDNAPIEGNALHGSDVVALQRGEMAPVTITGDMDTPNAQIQVQGALDLFEQDDLVLISDCEHADMFRITSQPDSGTWAHANGSNNANRLGQAYTDQANIMRFISSVYFIADTGRTGGDGNPVFALYRQRDNLINNAASTFNVEELVEGVESLQVLYGERLPNNNIRFVPAGTAGLDMTRVVALRVGMLISDSASVRDSEDTASYELPGVTVAPASEAGAAVTHPEDNRIRRAFIATIDLRNRE